MVRSGTPSAAEDIAFFRVQWVSLVTRGRPGAAARGREGMTLFEKVELEHVRFGPIHTITKRPEYGQLLPQDLTRHSMDPPTGEYNPSLLLTSILCQFSQHRGIEPTTSGMIVTPLQFAVL